MSDSKYGHIFTESDVLKILEFVIGRFDVEEEYDDKKTSELAGEMLGDVIAGEAGRLKFPADEPLFVLRGKDKRALAAVRAYSNNQNPRAPRNHLDGIEWAVRSFEKFRVKHADLMREPD